VTSCVRPSVCHLLLFPKIIEARGLKFGRDIPHMKGSKVTDQIFDILLRSRDI